MTPDALTRNLCVCRRDSSGDVDWPLPVIAVALVTEQDNSVSLSVCLHVCSNLVFD